MIRTAPRQTSADESSRSGAVRSSPVSNLPTYDPVAIFGVDPVACRRAFDCPPIGPPSSGGEVLANSRYFRRVRVEIDEEARLSSGRKSKIIDPAGGAALGNRAVTAHAVIDGPRNAA